MYWSYYPIFNYPIFFPNYCHQSYTQLQISQVKIQHQEPEQNLNNTQTAIPSKFSIPFKITLTAQQLSKAGYQTGKTSWSQQQDKLLKQLVKSTNSNWHKIASSIPGRNLKMCYSRYRRIRNTSRNYWKRSQDQMLKKLVLEFGSNWKHISTFFQDRTPKILKEHYVNQLAPNINKDQWTVQQDIKFIQLLNIHGRNWKVILKELQGRTVTQLKNRFFGRIKRLMEAKIKANQINQNLTPTKNMLL